MNRNKVFVILIIVLLLTVLLLIVKYAINTNNLLVSPKGQIIDQQSVVLTPASPNSPKEIRYDGATDLKQELDSVDPQVLDSDFEE